MYPRPAHEVAELRSRLEELALVKPSSEETFAEVDGAVLIVDRERVARDVRVPIASGAARGRDEVRRREPLGVREQDRAT